MKHGPLILAGALCAYGAYLLTQQGQTVDLTGGASQDNGNAAPDSVSATASSLATILDHWTGGILNLSHMKDAKPDMLALPNVQAFLKVIRRGEGTDNANGYREIFGGSLFNGFADHPRISITKSGITSTAAGAYQFLASTWDETRRIMGLADFSPANQDLAALGRIAARGALADVINGNFARAVKKTALEWASLPGSPYGQPTQSMSQATNVYLAAGGNIATA